ncbi:hypothetical protein CAPTEDRAFT_199609 [Capitella teleta]|uniref:Uncharacterized protein n=1 Tax=Capitella teleta TaxID=283909 RepID=R7UH87_CAPTE|nr:hypothetical protein CAPTEDRAFT_199609 [Capitella teleta]|eukprot:ELU02637.1 hypothetical protein CAPTEDRAFT_199609 [Capitella teleta]
MHQDNTMNTFSVENIMTSSADLACARSSSLQLGSPSSNLAYTGYRPSCGMAGETSSSPAGVAAYACNNMTQGHIPPVAASMYSGSMTTLSDDVLTSHQASMQYARQSTNWYSDDPGSSSGSNPYAVFDSSRLLASQAPAAGPQPPQTAGSNSPSCQLAFRTPYKNSNPYSAYDCMRKDACHRGSKVDSGWRQQLKSDHANRHGAGVENKISELFGAQSEKLFLLTARTHITD